MAEAERDAPEVPEVPELREMPRPRGVRLGRVLGTPVVLMPSWFVVAALVTLVYAPRIQERLPALGGGAFAVAFASALLLLLSVFLHELAHAIAARAVGTAPTHIALDLWGGHTAFAEELPTPGRSALVSLVGPLTNGLLAAIGWTLSPTVAGSGVGALLAVGFVYTNAFVAVFNALPGLPLDGGRALEALVWKVSGQRTLGAIAAGWCGRAVAVALLGWAVGLPLSQGRLPDVTAAVWLLVVAGLLWQGATQALRLARWRRRAPQVTVRALLRPAVGVAGSIPLREALAVARAAAADHVVLLGIDGAPAAVLDGAAAATVPADRIALLDSGSLSRALAAEAVLDADLGGEALIRRMQDAPHAEYAVLDEGGRVVGVLAWESVAADVGGH